MKIINIGAYPPPYGGVSVHLKRLLEYLQENGQESLLIDVSPYPKDQDGVVNYSRIAAIFYLLFRTPKSIVHFHNFSIRNTLVYFMISFRHKTILSFHNERFLDEIYSVALFWRKVVLYFLNRIDYFIVDTQKNLELVEKIVEDRNRIFVIPEFIPPAHIPLLENDAISAMRQKHQYLLASNAWQISFYKGQDLYGLDILVDLLEKLIFTHKMDVGVVFLLPNIGNEEYFEEITRRISSAKLTDHFIFITEPIEEATSLWQISDIVIRATNTDGNSLTILEALSIQVPVIASDCCERPEGVVLFKTRDRDDLCEKVLTVLSSLESHRLKLKNINQEDNAATLLELYRNIS